MRSLVVTMKKVDILSCNADHYLKVLVAWSLTRMRLFLRTHTLKKGFSPTRQTNELYYFESFYLSTKKKRKTFLCVYCK